ncbi:hypothetical protein AB0D65_29570 [Streptomyces griseoloalbus]|uniref:Uncharacterized protein n=1 Tax=Streptomyces griseoloalbus TaxID=67303 RepID=A0ABV3EER8_9ACTN
MTDRKHAARLADEDPVTDDFSRLEEAVDRGFHELFLEYRRTLERILEKVFSVEKDKFESVRRALKTVIEAADTDDLVIHFSTGTSYRVQVKYRSSSSTVAPPHSACSGEASAKPADALDALLQPLPPSERATRLLQQARHGMLNPPSSVPKWPLRREQERFGHFAVAVKERGGYQGVFRVADEAGANETYRLSSSGARTFTEDLDAWGMRTFAIFVDFEHDANCTAALIEPFRPGTFSRSSKVARALDIDLLLYLDGASE